MANDAENIRPFPKAGNGASSEAPVVPMQEPATGVAAPSAPVTSKKRSPRKAILPIVVLTAFGGGGWFGYNYYTVGRFMVSTDDAYIAGDIATISPKVMGYVKSVNVKQNQAVKAGDVLVTLDNGDYTIARQQAQATIDTQNLTLQRIDAQILGADAGVAQAQAQKTSLEAAQHNSQQAFDRSSQLVARNVTSQASLDQATAALDQSNASLSAADAAIAVAQANSGVLQAQRAEAASTIKSQQLVLDKANRDIGFTQLRAPYDGVVGNLAVQAGDLVAVGARLAAIVPVSDLYIDANFKETQLARLVPGAKVGVHVDALGDGDIVGTIESLSPASGSVFSLLPAENATGNFTKVVQRVPVRIALPAAALATGKLRAGLSVVVEVDTRTETPAN